MSSDQPISAQAQVLLIDDDPHLRQALSQTLDLAGLKVVSLGDARDLAARLPADWPGVVVSDIRMPGIDGLELLQQLRTRDSEMPVILITGHGDIQLAVQAMRAGAYDFLEKPFPSEALLHDLRTPDAGFFNDQGSENFNEEENADPDLQERDAPKKCFFKYNF